MMQIVREFRLIPVVLLATVCLFTLKVAGIVLDGGYSLRDADLPGTDRVVIERAALAPSPQDATARNVEAGTRRQSWAQEMFNFPGSTSSLPDGSPVSRTDQGTDATVTGSVAETKKPEQKDDKAIPVPPPPQQPQGTLVPLDANRPSAGERAILERLGERRQELDARNRELEIRENLLKSAEKRLETRTNELKDLESRINAATQKKDENQAMQLKGLVVMYENMKAKDAAKIFDRLEMRVLIDVVSQINPRRMADIMAQMSPESAEKLTVELANRATAAQRSLTADDLPKIEGRPTTTP